MPDTWRSAHGTADLVVTWLPQVAHVGLQVPPPVPVVSVLEEPWERVPLAVDLAPRLRPRFGILRRLDVPKARHLYANVGRSAAAIVCISKHDASYFERDIPLPKLHVLAHAIDTVELSPRRAPPLHADDTADVLLFGSMSQPRNLEPAVEFARAIKSQRRRVDVSVAGNLSDGGRRRFESLGVRCRGFVPDIRTALAGAKVVVVAQRDGTGSKTTLLEAWSMERPVVASRFAAEGVEARPTELVVADSPHGLAAAALRLLDDDTEREGFAARGRAAATSRHDIRSVAVEFTQICDRVLEESRR